MNKIAAKQSIESCLAMKRHDSKDYWLMKKWSERGHKISKKEPQKCFTFY